MRAPELTATLQAVARLMAVALDPWWIIASAGVALHGADPGAVGDIDVLASVRDADRLAALDDVSVVETPASTRFRSVRFLRWEGAALPVEIMAGFAVRTGAAWVPVVPLTREAVAVGPATVYVPSRDELRALILSFGRDKDVRRAALL